MISINRELREFISHTNHAIKYDKDAKAFINNTRIAYLFYRAIIKILSSSSSTFILHKLNMIITPYVIVNKTVMNLMMIYFHDDNLSKQISLIYSYFFFYVALKLL